MIRVLFVVAFLATVYATASYLTGFAGDFTVSAVVAVLALGGVFGLQERGRL